MKNKKGWIKIIEAFAAILLITIIMLLVITNKNTQNQQTYSKIYNKQILILREIQLNSTLRNDILNLNTETPVTGEDIPESIITKINQRKIPNLICKAIICSINSDCELENLPEKDIYVQSAVISATKEIYNPKQIKLFCWNEI